MVYITCAVDFIYKISEYILCFTVERKKILTLENILEVKTKVKGEITALKEKLKLARETMTKFKTELAKVQKPSLA